MRGTGIAAVVIKDAKGDWQEIRVFFQDMNNSVNEFAAPYGAPKWWVACDMINYKILTFVGWRRTP